MYQWNNTRIGKNVSFYIHVKSEHRYSPKYTEHVFSVFGLSLRRHGFDHKLRQITNCNGSVAMCDCPNLWRFKTQFHRLMSIVPGAVLPSSEKQVHIDSRPFQVSFLGTSYRVIITDIHTKRWTSEITPESANMKLFIFMSKVKMGTLPFTQNKFSVLFESICHVKALITNCNKSQIATIVSQFVTVAICDGSKYNFSDWCQLRQKVYS